MRLLIFPSLLVLVATSAASAQTAQTTVDIGVSTPSYSNGIVETRVTRKDPGEKLELMPGMTVRVTIALKGDKPFFSKDVVLKPGGYETIQTSYRGEASQLSFTVTAFALEMKELAPDDNTRTSEAAVITEPAPAPPAPAPAPTPPPLPSGASITTPQLVIVGGAAGSPAPLPTGVAITPPSLIIVGGAQHAPAALPTSRNIATPQLVLIGRRD